MAELYKLVRPPDGYVEPFEINGVHVDSGAVVRLVEAVHKAFYILDTGGDVDEAMHVLAVALAPFEEAE